MSRVLDFKSHKALRDVRGDRVLLARDVAEIYDVDLLELRSVLPEYRGIFPRGTIWNVAPEEARALGLDHADCWLVFRAPAIVNLCLALESTRAQEIRAALHERANVYREHSDEAEWDCSIGPSEVAVGDVFANHRAYRSRARRRRRN